MSNHETYKHIRNASDLPKIASPHKKTQKMKKIQISLKELLPIIGKKYSFVTEYRGYKETLYIHPENKPKEFTSLNMSYFPKIKVERLAVLDMAVLDILMAVNGFIPERQLLEYLEQYIDFSI